MAMSAYFEKLQQENPDVAARYLDKIQIIGSVDPYSLSPANLDYGVHAIPPISSIDIVSYLVLTHSFYTKDQMKAYKSLQAYKYFEAGFVQKVGCKRIDDIIVLVGKVKHSQRMNEKSLDAWVIANEDGSIRTAHCTCMAGNSEVCSHVSAILYAAEYAAKTKEEISCTDIKAAWPVPSTSKVPVVPVKNMNWGRSNKIVKTAAQPLDLVQFLGQLEESGCSAALMRIVDPNASNQQKAEDDISSIFDVYKKTNESWTYEQVIEEIAGLNFTISQKECDVIEKSTRKQNRTSLWYKQRAGRITASVFKGACRTKLDKPSLSLIKTICYPTSVTFSTKATSWGIKHEGVAARKYFEIQNSLHRILEMEIVGFVINPKYPQFGASPDRLIQCECCGKGCIEIKCPYVLRESNLKDFAMARSTCLIFNNEKIELNKNSEYYYQIQMQLLVTERNFCDFVVWSPAEVHIERIFPNQEFIKVNSELAKIFHKKVVLPELLSRYFTKKAAETNEEYICVCQSDDNTQMIKCANEECEIMWYHLRCMNLVSIPDGIWHCNACSVNIL